MVRNVKLRFLPLFGCLIMFLLNSGVMVDKTIMIPEVTVYYSTITEEMEKEMIWANDFAEHYCRINFNLNLKVIKQTKAVRYKNPGNLRGFRTSKFRYFKTLEEGYDALIADLQLKISGRSAHTDSTTTIKEFVYIYAPPFENRSDRYTKRVCEWMGVSEDYKLHDIQEIHKLAEIIIKVEDGNLYRKMYREKTDE